MVSLERLSENRSFPNFSWAWPRGNTETLIRAAAWTDDEGAAEIFRRWMADEDIEAVTYAEQRLLLAIAARFPQDRVVVPHRARLTGVQRLLWSKSRLAIKAAEPAFEKFRAAGIDVLVFKGAARAAVNMNDLKGRIAHDVDILVKRQDFTGALKLLTDDGWQPSNGCSAVYCQAVAPSIRGLNLFRGKYGDLDLHQRILHQYTVLDEAESAVWSRAREVAFLGGKAFVADPTDALVIAIAHGGLDGHNHSDWIVDSAALVAENEIDWELFLRQCRQYGIMPHAAIALTFLASRLQSAIPAAVVETVISEGKASRPALFSALFQSHPKRQHSVFGLAGRTISKQWRLYRTRSEDRKASPYLSDIRLRPARKANRAADEVPPDGEFSFPIPGDNPDAVSFTIALDGAPVRRRYVFELNSGQRHIARFAYRHGGRRKALRLSGACRLPGDLSASDEPLVLSARPSKCFAGGYGADEEARYAAAPFQVTSFRVSRLGE
ncbi:nucleotidyltransferase family protein [Nitratireductor sp. XY-223]|uniref:nucleotidyltransferase family protein n=1 Tax=Nitratireductor sp. XY-223 TaxID=2561926 RepID=UPI0010A9D119|nr:nucleotidyltransferase family protein [Nitratireductor sp. XY-223]